MIKLLFIIIPIFLFASGLDISSLLVNSKDETSFITTKEYGEMLYNNPRGISCKKCHGKNGKGKFIAKFIHRYKGVKYICEIKTKDIRDLSFQEFKDKLTNKTKKIKLKKDDICLKLTYGNSMPKYFLTNEELNTLYFYITNGNKNE